MNVTDITRGGLLSLTGRVEFIHESEYVGKKGYEVRKVQIRDEAENGLYEFEFFGNDIPDDLDSYNVGDIVEIRFRIQQREYNGKMFTKLSAKTLAHGGSTTPTAEGEDAPEGEMPF